MDDTFIILSSWGKHSEKPVRDRISATLAESAVSITVTTLTNVLSFAIAASSPFPAIRIFSINTGFSLFFAYLYQVTFFAACLTLGGFRESKKQHCCACVKVLDPVTARKRGMATYLLQSGDVAPCEATTDGAQYKSFSILKSLMIQYAKILITPAGIIITFVVWSVYLTVSGYGVAHLTVGLDPPRLVHPKHPGRSWYSINERFFWKYGDRVDVIVSHPPKLYDPKERNEFLNYVASFENTTYIWDSRYTFLWLREYMAEKPGNESISINDPEYWQGQLCDWLDTSSRAGDHSPVVWVEGKECQEMAAFRFIVGLRNFIGAKNQADASQSIRAIASATPQYQAVSYNFLWEYMDQYTVIVPYTLKSSLIGLVTMFGVALLFFPTLVCALLIAFSVFSVVIGVAGGFYFWDVSLDFASMVNIILAMGLGVDLTAHVAHAFTIEQGTPKDRAILALRDVGTPVLQGGFSTLLTASALVLGSEDYVMWVFFKTIILVVFSGLLHACAVIPVLMFLACTVKSKVKVKPLVDLKLKCSRTMEKPPQKPSDADKNVPKQCDCYC